MIVRILGEAQYEVAASEVPALEKLDHKLSTAIDGGDEAAFDSVLSQLHEMVRTVGKKVAPETIVPSDLTLPQPGSSLSEVRELLASEDMTGD